MISKSSVIITGAGGISSRELDRFVRERHKLEEKLLRCVCNRWTGQSLYQLFRKVYDKSTQKLSFAIANTDHITKGGTHWFSLIKLQDSNSFFMFNSFGLMGLSSFILSDDTDLLSAFMRNLKKWHIRRSDKPVLFWLCTKRIPSPGNSVKLAEDYWTSSVPSQLLLICTR